MFACLLAFAAADMSLRVMVRVEVAVYCLPLFWQARPTFFFSDPNVICFRIVAIRKIFSRWALSGIFFLLSSLRHQVALWKSEVDRGARTQVVFPKLNKTRCKPRIFIVQLSVKLSHRMLSEHCAIEDNSNINMWWICKITPRQTKKIWSLSFTEVSSTQRRS